MVTLEELKLKIANYYDEVSILELLNIDSFDLVERFSDRIFLKIDELSEEFEEENDSD